jgi:ssDNA-binding Zn-finger/Zn-ribbon topoisomerase 1
MATTYTLARLMAATLARRSKQSVERMDKINTYLRKKKFTVDPQVCCECHVAYFQDGDIINVIPSMPTKVYNWIADPRYSSSRRFITDQPCPVCKFKFQEDHAKRVAKQEKKEKKVAKKVAKKQDRKIRKSSKKAAPVAEA